MTLIHDQARRLARYAWVERRLFEIVGAWSADECDADAVPLFAAEARHHAWRAAMLEELRPVLHDVDAATLMPSADVVHAFVELARTSTTLERVTALDDVVLPRLLDRYDADLASGDPVADAPVLRVLRLLRQDANEDWQAAARLQRSVVRTEEDNARAAAHQSKLEVLLLPCWEL